jgi:hypothetical protein
MKTEKTTTPTGKIKKPRRPDAKKLFTDRLKHEGRYDQYEPTLLQVMTETGATSRLSCQHEAMRRLGMKTPDEERVLAKERGYTEQIEFDGDLEVDEQIVGSLGLPMNAPRLAELEWVSGHPLMVMAKEQTKGDAGKGVKVLLSHVTKTPHGQAPSVTAVSMLAYYVNKPGELYKVLGTVAKDQAAASKGAESDKDISAIAQLIREVKGQ